MKDVKPLTLTPRLKTAARRCVWWKRPIDAIAVPTHFIAYVLTYGTAEDVSELRRQIDDRDLRDAIDNAPPGVFDPRSWAYWNLMLGRYKTPPMPQRTFGGKRQVKPAGSARAASGRRRA